MRMAHFAFRTLDMSMLLVLTHSHGHTPPYFTHNVSMLLSHILTQPLTTTLHSHRFDPPPLLLLLLLL